MTGSDEKIEAFESLVRPFGLIEMVRTGEIAVQRGRHDDLMQRLSDGFLGTIEAGVRPVRVPGALARV